MKTSLFLLLATILILSCQRVEEKQISSTFHLQKIGEKSFFLDSLTRPTSQVQYWEDSNNNPFFTLLNGSNNSIYFYPFQADSSAFKISFDKEGPHGVTQIHGYQIISLDSILIFNRGSEILRMVDKKGTTLFQYALPTLYERKDTIYYPGLEIYPITPALFLNNEVYMSGYTFGEFPKENDHNRPICLKIPVKSNTVAEPVIAYPPIYFKYNWGGLYYRMVYHTLFQDKFILFSFPADHHIYQYDIDSKKVKKYLAKSNHFDEISPFSTSKRADIEQDEPVQRHNVLNGRYISIIYDKYRHLIYRFVELPKSEYDKDDPFKLSSVIILDEQFNYLGEMVFDYRSDSKENFFVAPDGLYLKCVLSCTSPSENYATYSIFVPTEISEKH